MAVIKSVPVIIAGGCGSRLWPLSRAAYPKQFLPLLSEQTLLQETLARCAAMPHASDPVIVCHQDHRFVVAEQCRAIGITPLAIILEPVPRNTAPAIALAAHAVREILGDALLWVMPADHQLGPVDALSSIFKVAEQVALANQSVVFGVQPTAPETGYGYIKAGVSDTAGVYPVLEFVEKPELPRAEQYVASGDYYWNSGMFVFRATHYLNELATYAPAIAASTAEAMQAPSQDGWFIRPDDAAFCDTQSDSIDYAVMEKTQTAVLVPLACHWNDVGSWNALMATQEKDQFGNVIKGDVITHDVSNCYVDAGAQLLALSGVNNVAVVATDDAVLVTDLSESQSVKHLVSQLKEAGREEAELHLTVHRPWGYYCTIASGDGFKVKRIVVSPQHTLSLQSHVHRSEHWVVVRGDASILNGNIDCVLHKNESTFIPKGTKHRLANKTDLPLEIVEVQVGEYLGEDDIQRYDDAYGRVETEH